ncbi:MDR family MFS transporter [Corynebacterium sp. L4756]|uniref:MDR family MFS transporter n=1 Tax=unclassified Corynebacterium TaxID=2624378 RepID=UPI00374DB18C
MATPSATDPNRGKKTADNVGIIFSALMLTMLMSSLGQMIFGSALPTIVGELGGVDQMSWVISAFMVTMTIAMPLAGQLGDRIGRKWVYIGGIAIFVIGSTIGGFASGMGVLIAGRAIQGFGAGIMMISSQAIVAEVVSARERGKFMGIMGGVFGVSSVLGPVLGGWFTDGPGWRWGLWINIPLGLLAIIVCIFVLKLRVGDAGFKGFDWLGFAGIAITTSSLILMTTWGGSEYEWTSPTILSMGAIVILGAAFTIFVETRASQPLIPVHLFKNRNMVLTTLAGTVLGLAMMGVLGYMPTYLQMVHTLSPTEAGLMMIPMMIGMIGVSTGIGFIISKTGNYKMYPIIGLAITAVALWLMSQMTKDTTLTIVGALFFLFGVGLGFVMQVLVLIVQNSFPIAQVGTATAANNFFRQIGSALGASVVGSMFIHNMQNEMSTRLPEAIASMGQEGAVVAEQFAGADAANSLTPQLVAQLPDAVRDAILTSYNDGLTPVIGMMVPLAIIAMLLLIPLREERLKETID